MEGGLIDEDTYVEQGRDLERAYSLQVIKYVLGSLQRDTDLAMVGYPFTDEVSHQFLGLVTRTDADGAPNPCYDVDPKFDDVVCTGRGKANRVAIREGYIRSAYADADEKLAVARKLMGGNPVTFAGSDHGFAPQWWAVNANNVLNKASLGGVSLHASNASAIELQRREHRSDEGLLGRRDDPDLHQPGWPEQRDTADRADVRGGSHGNPLGVRGPDGPREPR